MKRTKKTTTTTTTMSFRVDRKFDDFLAHAESILLPSGEGIELASPEISMLAELASVCLANKEERLEVFIDRIKLTSLKPPENKIMRGQED